jgi:non-heme chloroperoxidase
MQVGLENAYECITAFSETDFTEDLRKFDVPTLIVHGEDDQLAPVAATALRAAELIGNSTLKVYPGAPHGLTDTHTGRLNEDMVGFIQPARGRLVA